MNYMRVISFLSLSLVVFLSSVEETEGIYAYAVKGIVKDVRLHPTRFIGGWFFKKAFILIKLKLKLKLKKKLILKKLLKKKLLFLVGGAVLKLKSKGGIKIFAPKIILPPPPRYFAHGWGPVNYWTHAPIDLFFRRKKRAVRFPGESNQSQQNFDQSQSLQNNDEYFHRYNIGSLGLSQSDLDQLRRLPESLKNEYGHEMEQLEAAASEPKEEDIKDYFSIASEFDNSACIPKSICEIMARGNHTDNPFENQIFQYYSEPDTGGKQTGSPTYVYDYAANLGKSTRDPRVCSSHFSSCSDEPKALNSFMNDVFSPDLCDPTALFSRSDHFQYS